MSPPSPSLPPSPARVQVRICFVCAGNICRSPTAEAIFRRLVVDAGLAGRIEIDSAGTGAWNEGAPPDPHASAAAALRGVSLEGVSRPFAVADFERFDWVVAMDRDNERDLLVAAPHPAARERVLRLRALDPDSEGEPDVPDPYRGSGDGFARVFDIIERGCRHLLERVRPS